MMNARSFAVAAVLLCASSGAAADSDGQVWYGFFGQERVAERWKVWTEIQARYGRDMTTLGRLLLRPAIQYGLPNGLSFWAGYLWHTSYQPVVLLEHRPWQQLQHDWKDGDEWWVQNRLRLEERWTPQVSGSIRLRYQLRALRQVRGGVYGVASAEIFETLADPLPGSQGGFDQARLFAGAHFNVSPEVRLETGYMFNPVNRRGDGPTLYNHNWILSVFWNPDFS